MPRLLKFALSLLAAAGLLLLPTPSPGQNVNVRYDNVVWTVAYISGQQTYVPVPGAQVQICAYPANAVPCTNLATLFVGPTVLGGVSTNPVQADQFGNFGFWAAAGYYSYTVTNPLGQSAGPYPLTLGGSGGSGGTFALFPATQGIVFNTSTTSATTATSAQIVAALNNSPSAQLSLALIPPLSGIIPATTNLLKGSGVAGSAAAATPGTDYLIPGALPNGTTATTQSPGDSSAKLATDAFVLANTTGAPGGANTQIQFNDTGAFAGDPVFTFDNSGKKVTVGPLGTANSSANFNSGTLQICDSYWTGSAGAPGCWSMQAIPFAGTNPYDILTLGYTGSPQSGQINFPFSQFQVGFALNAGNGSNIIQFKGPANLPAAYSLFWPNAPPTSGNTLLSCSPGISSICTWAGGTGGALAVTPQQFGGFGDAFSPPDGFNTTASSTTVTFTDGSLISTAVDGGKDVWIWGAGAAGAAFHSTIVSVTNSTTAVLAAAPSATLSNAHGVYGHDDKVAIQSCLQYSSINSVQCFAVPAPAPAGQSGLIGFLVGTGSLQLVSNNALEESSGPNLVGSSQSSGTNLFCEFNGDCLNLASGPIQGASVSNIDFQEDPSQPNSRGIHLNPQAGTFGNGPFTNSNFTNVNVDNPAKECLWLDGGGGPGYTFNLPNQYVQFTQFWCNGPNRSHPANLILMTGQAAQIIFTNGQVNGQGWVQSGSGGSTSASANYPNPLIKITEKTSTLGDTPVDVKFYGYTIEVGTQGLYIGNGANNIHYDNSYIENISTPFIVTGAVENTFNGNHIANSGNITGVYQFAASSGASVRDTLVYGGVALPAAWATCSGSNQVVFENNNSGSGVTTTTSCVTVTGGSAAGSMSLPTVSSSASITEPDTVPISTLSAPGVAPGKTLTLYGAGAFELASGGNISLGGLTSPVRMPSGGSATLTLMDSGVTWLLTSSTGATSIATRKGTFTCTAGGTITIANTNERATSDVVISLNAQGGTISTAPAMKTITAGTGFTVLCGAADTSTYNFNILD